ncbi:hypothetical protein EW146_g5931 [Bondarzewia mesenterica]|uniref:Uncharacterized protein n=1 Tax=Bondarzewia mesenterica TaxID=1095465 RepID=A0A4S4LQ16_9AGAM|nr:hypothetical protein EW146_g5931 [Bondarzewia mesenterica]
MSREGQTFLFDSLKGRQPLTARHVHIRRLYDILQLSIHRADTQRAQRAFSILSRCKEVNWKDMWRTGLLLLGGDGGSVATTRAGHTERQEFLRVMMLQHPEDAMILQELILSLILSGREREALDELELYLPSFPYQDNSVLHTYAGIVSLYLAQPPETTDATLSTGSTAERQFNESLVRDAQGHLERAVVIDAENMVAQAFLSKVCALHDLSKNRTTVLSHLRTHICTKLPQTMDARRRGYDSDNGNNSENDDMSIDNSEGNQRRKRART